MACLDTLIIQQKIDRLECVITGTQGKRKYIYPYKGQRAFIKATIDGVQVQYSPAVSIFGVIASDRVGLEACWNVSGRVSLFAMPFYDYQLKKGLVVGVKVRVF